MIKEICENITKDLSLFTFKNYDILYKNMIIENCKKDFPKYDCWLLSKSISYDIEIFKDFWLYIRMHEDSVNSKIFQYKLFFNNTVIVFLQNGEILNNKTKLNNNIFNWTEEDFFYLSLKG